MAGRPVEGCDKFFCTVSKKNTDIAHYNFNAHQPILYI